MAVNENSVALLGMRNKLKEARKLLRDTIKDKTVRGAKKRVFVDGSVGYGAYRKRRRTRRRFGRRYRGRGGYFDDAVGWLRSNVPKGLAASAGKYVGNALGGPSWGMVGQGLGSAFSNWSGIGEYHEDGPSVLTQNVPQITNTRGDDGAVVIRHREFIGDVTTASAAFALVYNLNVNPGLASTFPWLSGIAKNFTQYKVEGLMFSYVSTSGSLSTSQSLGEIVMACNYNVLDPPFRNKHEMLNEVFAVSKVPSCDSICPVECDKAQTPMDQLLIRSGGVPYGQDPRFYDLCSFQMATQGGAEACTLGELWVTYQIALYKPQLASNTSAVSLGYSLGMLEGDSNTGLTGPGISYIKGFNEVVAKKGSEIVITIPHDSVPIGTNLVVALGGYVALPTNTTAYPNFNFSDNFDIGPNIFIDNAIPVSLITVPMPNTTTNRTLKEQCVTASNRLRADWTIGIPTTWGGVTQSKLYYMLFTSENIL